MLIRLLHQATVEERAGCRTCSGVRGGCGRPRTSTRSASGWTPTVASTTPAASRNGLAGAALHECAPLFGALPDTRDRGSSRGSPGGCWTHLRATRACVIAATPRPLDRRERLRGAGRCHVTRVLPPPEQTRVAAHRQAGHLHDERPPVLHEHRVTLLADGIRAPVLVRAPSPGLSVPGSGTISASAPPSFTAGSTFIVTFRSRSFVELCRGSTRSLPHSLPGCQPCRQPLVRGVAVVGRFVPCAVAYG